MCVRGIDVASVAAIARFYYETVPTVWYFFFFSFIRCVFDARNMLLKLEGPSWSWS